MGDRRIQVAADKSDFLQQLKTDGDMEGPFQEYYDALVFAAALGAAKGQSKPLGKIAKDRPAPIRMEIFERNSLDTVINILAVYQSKDPNVLANTDEMEDRRATIFEEFANAGMEILQHELAGAPSYSEQLMLLLQKEQHKSGKTANDDFDITDLLD